MSWCRKLLGLKDYISLLKYNPASINFLLLEEYELENSKESRIKIYLYIIRYYTLILMDVQIHVND